jgi:hypothetical protein
MKILVLIVCYLLAWQNLFADDTAPSALMEIAEDFVLSTRVDSQVDLQTARNGNGTGTDTRIGRESFFQISNSMLGNKIHLSLGLKLETLFKENKIKLKDKDFNWQEFVKEAKIEIREIMGMPVAIIVGKQPIPFANVDDLKKLGEFDDDELSSIEDIKEVFGISLRLTPNILNSIFKIDLSVFESKSRDLEIGSVDSFSVRLTKSVTDNTEISFSHARLGNKDNKDLKTEERSVVGIITRTNGDLFTGWIHGIHVKNNPQFPDAKYGLSMGVFVQSPVGSIIAEYNWLSNTFHELGIGLNFDLFKNLGAGVSTRYRMNDNGSAEWITGMELKVIFSSEQSYYQQGNYYDSIFESIHYHE